MGQSTEELSSEIAQTRTSLSSDLDALQDRVSPSAIVERRKAAARSKVRQVRQRVMGTVHDARNTTASGMSSAGGSAQGAVESARDTAQEKYDGAPLAAGLVAFGAGMVLASLIPASEKEAVAAGKVLDAAKEQGQPLLEEAKGQAQQVAQQAGQAATEALQEVKDTAAEGADRVRSEGQSAAESVRDEARSE
jgi:cell division septum initiation protein DivIVA